jgi:hypothetical protein
MCVNHVELDLVLDCRVDVQEQVAEGLRVVADLDVVVGLGAALL